MRDRPTNPRAGYSTGYDRPMRRKTAAALLIGCLLGISTSFAVPTLVYQRQSLFVRWPRDTFGGVGGDKLIDAIDQGWVVTQQGGYLYEMVYTLEPPWVRIP